VQGSTNSLPATREAAHLFYRAALDMDADDPELLRLTFWELQSGDFFFFALYCLEFDDFKYLDNDWVFDRCREIQREPWGHLDLWARAHFKTSLLTVAHSLWEACNNPEETYGIFSMTSGLAKKIGTQIKRYLEKPHMTWVFKDALYENPVKNAPGWSVDGGLMLRRKGNPREASFEFFGMESFPTGRHFSRLRGDDLVDQTYATNPAMVEKAVNLIQLLTPLRTPDAKWGLAGTRYDNADAYGHIIEQGMFKPRIYTPTVNGEVDGELVLFTAEQFREWMQALGQYHAACQLFQKPQALSLRQLDPAWLKRWDPEAHGWDKLNRFLIVDPASKKGKDNDYTAASMVGLGDDNNAYLIDLVRDRLSLQERAKAVMTLCRKYLPMYVFYEGAQGDIEYIEEVMGREQFRVPILQMSTSGRHKVSAIDCLQPLAAEGHLYIPHSIPYVAADGHYTDLVTEFVRDEWMQWPKPKHDDILDTLARIVDSSEERIVWPRPRDTIVRRSPQGRYDAATGKRTRV
jgi:phage terminase large subunit-like protein